jgi:hypothetical protein
MIPAEVVQQACLAYGGGAFPERIRAALEAVVLNQVEASDRLIDALYDSGAGVDVSLRDLVEALAEAGLVLVVGSQADTIAALDEMDRA